MLPATDNLDVSLQQHRSLQRRVLLKLILPIALLLASLMTVLLYRQSQTSAREQGESAVAQVREQAFSFGLMLKTATLPAARNAQLASLQPDLPNTEYWKWFKGLLDDSPALYGTGVTFWPANRGGQRKDLYALRGKDGNHHDAHYAYQDETYAYEGYNYDGADGTHDYFNQPQKTGKPGWTKPYFDDGSGNVWMVTYSMPFYAASTGAFDGVAFSDIRIDTLRSQMQVAGNFHDGDFVVISREGEYVYHPDASLIGKPVAEWKALGPLAAWLASPLPADDDEPPQHTDDWPGGRKVWVARHAISETGWVLASVKPDNSVLFSLSVTDFATSAVLVIALVLSLLVTIRLTRRLTTTIAGMSEAAESVTRGQWNIQLPETGARELASLARSLNRMAKQLSSREAALRQQHQQLLDFNRDLEGKVRARTVELSAARAEAERANAAKSRFLANISHELRTPMNAIIGFAQLSQTLSAEVFKDKAEDYFSKITQAGKTLRALIDDLLDFSKMEAGGLQLESAPFLLSSVIDEVLSLNGEAARQKNLQLKISLSPAVRRPLSGDALRLTQVLSNLLSNAVKFTTAGEVELSAAVAPKGAGAGRIRLRFAVRDTGIGIAADVLPQLFQPFVQADVSISRRYGGTGLGLAICRELVQLMDGEISVESKLGQGSLFTFEVSFDLTDAVPAVIHEALPPPAALRGRRVLLAEDGAVNREVVREMLQRAGVVVTEAGNGEEALHALRQGDFDLVLMDLQMPVMDGLSTTRTIRKEPRWARLPVIAITANAMAADQQACRDAGMTDHIAKPVDVAVLYAKLAEHLAG